ncbi:alpha/beta hydrolase [Agromyces mariniharenae]|uniref:Alpha/beta hydrolase n=1 Tax=Agromyces mariniharenae TaxID=2604423 RepID=A0A5S4V225_9MICO|nr:alpha/beta hydrolase [Agromyces mariniharenae]TYL53187.1 alpha/beta hydrolase [Agromyces mariniharenae]
MAEQQQAEQRTDEQHAERWRPDVLGDGFEQLSLPLGSDDEGDLVATLVRHRPARRFEWPWERRGAASGCDVLYVHGWSDYFFNRELAAFWSAAGARFFALDLRKYGRSLRPGQTPGFITDLAAYDVDIEAALTAMGHGADAAASARPLVLLGHSTGGLTLSLWAARHPGRAAALVLNSPWLEFQLSRVGREAITPMVAWGARVNPMGPMPNVDLGFYTRSVSKEFDGEWEYDPAWRPERGFTTHPAWLTAILAGHAKVAAGIDVGAPVLTLLSARSTIQAKWDDAMLTTDIVLVVDDIADRVLKLGPEVTVARIDGAMHDVFLSREPPRTAAYAAITRWLRGYRPRS